MRIQVFTHHHKASFNHRIHFISYIASGACYTHIITCLIHDKISNISCLIIIIKSVHCFLDKYLLEFAKAISVKKIHLILQEKNHLLWLSEINL